MIEYTDTHFHLGADRDAALYASEALQAGVVRMMLCSSDFADSVRAAKAACENERIYAAVGVHPHESQAFDYNVSDFKALAAAERVVAIGEIGLDYFYDISPGQTQRKVFEVMLGLALELKLPAVIHCRDAENSESAYADAFSLLKDFAGAGGRFAMHCYAGSPEYMERFAQLGSYFGVGGMATFKRADNIRKLAALYPSDRVMLETDAPWLAPAPHRGSENHSKYIPLIAAALADARGIGLEECASLTNSNASEFFNLQ